MSLPGGKIAPDHPQFHIFPASQTCCELSLSFQKSESLFADKDLDSENVLNWPFLEIMMPNLHKHGARFFSGIIKISFLQTPPILQVGNGGPEKSVNSPQVT